MNRTVRPLAALTLLLAILSGCQEKGFVIRPYLQNPGQTEMTLMWTMAEPGAVEVRYGAGDKLDQVATSYSYRLARYSSRPPVKGQAVKEADLRNEYVYQVRLAGLTPGTAYSYRVKANSAAARGAFRTSPDKAEPFTFVAYGDSRTDFVKHGRIAKGIASKNPALVIHTGDLVTRGSQDEYRAQFFGPLKDVVGRIPVWAQRGNHEGDGVAFKALFPNHPPARWYSFDYANAHFVGLDSHIGANSVPDMLAWLEQDLAASAADWKIVFYHLPTYDVAARHTTWGRKDFAPIFRKHKVDLVIAGHSHSYQRFVPMFTPGENDQHPITYMVAAGGGASLTGVELGPYVAAGAKKHNFVEFNVDGQKLSARTYDIDGQQIDAFEINKVNGQPDKAYVASALPETDFEKIRDLIAPCLRGIYLPAVPQPGKPVAVRFAVGAGDQPMKFRIRLDGGGHYVMNPAAFEGSSPANGTAEVSVTIRAKGETGVTKSATLDPDTRFICDYEIGNQKGFIFGGSLRYQKGVTSAPDGDEE